MPNAEPSIADIEAAIGRLTRALATADDDTIADLVAERKAMRAELRAVLEREAGNVRSLDDARRSRS